MFSAYVRSDHVTPSLPGAHATTCCAQGSVIFKDAEVGQALTPEYQAQLLAQMSVMRDMQEAQATDPANTKVAQPNMQACTLGMSYEKFRVLFCSFLNLCTVLPLPSMRITLLLARSRPMRNASSSIQTILRSPVNQTYCCTCAGHIWGSDR